MALVNLLLLLLVVSCGYEKGHFDCSDAISQHTSQKPGAITIEYRISDRMNAGGIGKICTPRPIKQKIKKILELYESIDEFAVQFRYAGVFHNREANYDGKLYFNLDDDCNSIYSANACGGPIGAWGAAGSYFNSVGTSVVSQYPGGEVNLGAHHGTHELTTSIMIHEAGHALGLTHIPVHGSHMTYEGGPGEFFSLAEQDIADLTAVFPSEAATLFQIRGKVTWPLECDEECLRLRGPVAVHAVNVVTGRTFTGLSYGGSTQNEFPFLINLIEAGDYRIFARPTFNSESNSKLQYSPSWYVSTGVSTNDPVAGATLTLSSAVPTLSDIEIPFLKEAVPFPLPTLARDDGFGRDTIFFMKAGEAATVRIQFSCQTEDPCDSIQVVEPYGSSPDFTLDNLQRLGDYVWLASLTVSQNSSPGHRTVLFRAASGNVQAWTPGLHILRNAQTPEYLSLSLPLQLRGMFDFATLNQNYWK